MHIKIAQRLHPFSHEMGTFCLIPKTNWEIQVFPTLLRLRDLQTHNHIDIQLFFKGPFKNFTLEQDLEKARLRIFGLAAEGYIEYTLSTEHSAVVLLMHKLPKVISCQFGERSLNLQKGDSISLPISVENVRDSNERLSLGMHRQQDWQLVKRRSDLLEIIPTWLRLASLIPEKEKEKIPSSGTYYLVAECKKAIEQKDKIKLFPLFTQLFQTAFEGILSPRLTDECHQGILPQGAIPSSISALGVLTESATLLRALFFNEQQECISFLPCLPPQAHSGRFIGITTQNGDEIAFEWSKKLLKKVIWHSNSDQKVELKFQKALHSFRIRHSLKERGKRQSCDEPLILKKGQRIFLDRFEK